MSRNLFDIKPLRIKPTNLLGFGKASGREPLPAKIKNAVKDRVRFTCEFRGCNHKSNLQFHHKNMRNNDNRISNIELLCPNHHMKRHDEKRRKIISKDIITGKKTTRLIKKTKKKPPKPKPSNLLGSKPLFRF